MKKLLILIVLISGLANAQQEAFTIKNPYRNTDLNPKATFVVEDETSGNFAVFMISRGITYGFLYDKYFEKIKHIRSTKLPSKFISFQVYTIKENTYTFLMNTANNRSYGTLVFDFDTGAFDVKETDFKLKKERLLSVVSNFDTCHLITISKKENHLIIYSFKDNWDKPLKKIINFDGDYFKEETNNNYTFKELFYDKFSLTNISNEHPNSIKQASDKVKIYTKDLDVQITSNKYSEKTFIIDFNIATGNKNIASFSMPQFEKEGFFPKSNSYLIDDKLFQVRGNNLKLALNITDTKTDVILNNFYSEKELPIKFKNGPIIQKKRGLFEEQRDIKTTSAFLRKLQVLDIGVAVYKDGKDYIFNMGGHEEESGNLFIYIPGGGFVGGVISGVASGFLNYTYSKSLLIEGILDENFEHQNGTVAKNIFNLISDFSDQKKTKAETLFKKDETYYWGTYSSKYDHYTFYSFRE
ncbi:hypothetical protein ULMS_05700 [Patiriisocius marinistellae]|uniref:Uncharacterized protein n=1 Tax=Patiriisocius marinistellae TaxID=2494560 RepID=A0A5J4FVG2_9FLAO|nr:hypothetical protein [Patiriisocius marinistellae]GEQ85062.1 hypothetical protein ULMS_05700 [Patiriisocius marinistellae]